MVGRTNELQRIDELLDQVTVDQGQIISIIGEAGIGKTRLAVALKDLSATKSFLVCSGAFALNETNIPYKAFKEIGKQLQETLPEGFWQKNLDSGEIDFLQLLISPEKRIERFARYSDEEIRQGLYYTVKKVLNELAKKPMMLVIEDLHWADPNSLQLLEYLIEGIEETKLALVLIHRPSLKPSWENHLNYNQIALSPLSEEQIDELLESSMGVSRSASSVRKELYRSTLGNPLFVEEMLRELLNSKRIKIEKDEEGENILRLSGGTTINVPTTLHSLISSRFDQLEKPSREALKWAVLLGPTFSADEFLALIKNHVGQESEKIITNLFENEYLNEKSAFPEKLYEFEHSLIFETIRSSMGEADRKTRQTKVAEQLIQYHSDEAETMANRIADHYLDSDDRKASLTWAKKAGKQSLDLFNYPLARDYFENAANAWSDLGRPKQEVMHDVFRYWTRALLMCGDSKAARSVLRQWETDLGLDEPKWKLTYLILSSEVFRAVPDHQRSLDAAKEAEAISRLVPESDEERTNSLYLQIRALIFLGRGRDAIHIGLRTLREIEEDDYPMLRFRIWARLAYLAVAGGEINQGLDYLNKARKIPGDRIAPRDLIDFNIQAAFTYREGLAYDKAVGCLKENLRIAREASIRVAVAESLQALVFIYLGMGAYTQALSSAKAALDETQNVKNRQLEKQVWIDSADCHAEFGDNTESERILKLVDDGFDDVVDVWSRGDAKIIRTKLYLNKGSLHEAIDVFRDAEALYARAGNRMVALRLRTQRLSVEAKLGRLKKIELERELNNILSLAANINSPKAKLQLWITMMDLASIGINVPNLNPDEFDLKKVYPVWPRLMAYMSKIRYLRSVGKEEEAKDLEIEYRGEFQAVAQNVPADYRDGFLEHPLFSPTQLAS